MFKGFSVEIVEITLFVFILNAFYLLHLRYANGKVLLIIENASDLQQMLKIVALESAKNEVPQISTNKNNVYIK